MAFGLNPAGALVAAVKITDVDGESSTTRLRLTPDNAIGLIDVTTLTLMAAKLRTDLAACLGGGVINQITLELPFIETPLLAPTPTTYGSVDDKASLTFRDPSSGNYLRTSFSTPGIAAFQNDTETVDNSGVMGTFISDMSAGFSDGTNNWFLTTEDGQHPVDYVKGYRSWTRRKGGSRPQ